MNTDRQGVPEQFPEDQAVVDVIPELPVWVEIYHAQWRPRGVQKCRPT
jgi:hypothetical protein